MERRKTLHNNCCVLYFCIILNNLFAWFSLKYPCLSCPQPGCRSLLFELKRKYWERIGCHVWWQSILAISFACAAEEWWLQHQATTVKNTSLAWRKRSVKWNMSTNNSERYDLTQNTLLLPLIHMGNTIGYFAQNKGIGASSLSWKDGIERK